MLPRCGALFKGCASVGFDPPGILMDWPRFGIRTSRTRRSRRRFPLGVHDDLLQIGIGNLDPE
ncbi:MAG: hypothetical protein LWW81_11255, partial [Rhodocyclales bacterium]|nr:hypothetical protein [Rhodocyclales bacterium]